MSKIKMKTTLFEMDGYEMTRILWKWIKEILLEPYVELNTEYYALGLEHREATKDQVTLDSAEATKKYGVAVKCATITPNAARMPAYNLTQMRKTPYRTITAAQDASSRTCGLLQRIRFQRSMTIVSRIFSRKYMTMNIKKSTKLQELSISTRL